MIILIYNVQIYTLSATISFSCNFQFKHVHSDNQESLIYLKHSVLTYFPDKNWMIEFS